MGRVRVIRRDGQRAAEKHYKDTPRRSSPSLLPTPRAKSPATPEAITVAKVKLKPDGATVHYVSVNVMVFKLGRITVLPALVFSSEGLGATPA
jgi:hypothetical protein